MRFILPIILIASLNSVAYADATNSLILTDAEMQKLKKYFPSDEISHMVWKGDPISITLPVNKEKRLIFPSNVSVDVKSALTADQLRLLNNDKSLYLTALKPFASTRIYVSMKESGEVMLLDLMTDPNASNNTQQIDIEQISTHTENNKIVDSTIIEPTTAESNPDVNFADLIRFAWQQAYAPSRLIQNSYQYARSPMHTEKFVSDLIYGDKVIAYPESSWMSGNHFVTAVFLRNKYDHKVHIDIRKDICGDWEAVSIYPSSTLQNYGDKRGDSAMLLLVSNHSFGETMGVCHGDA